MAQVLINFRIDEEVKKDMEQACREMGLSMSTAFTLFAKKVGKEKRIPFEISAVKPSAPEPYGRQRRSAEHSTSLKEESIMFARRQERLELLCTSIRRSLTNIHTAIPSSITGLTMERIRMLCGDELKDKAAGAASASRALFSSRNADMLREKDLSLLDEYIESLSSIAQELLELEHTLIPAMKAWRGEDAGCFEPYERRLAAVSQKLDGLPNLMQRFLCSSASGAQMIRARIQQALRSVKTSYILTALENLEGQMLRHYDALDGPTKARLESDYLPTLELTLRTLGQAEQDGEDVGNKAALCLRVINVMSQVISDSRLARQEWSDMNLEAEVESLECMAAMRGDIAGGLKL